MGGGSWQLILDTTKPPSVRWSRVYRQPTGTALLSLVSGRTTLFLGGKGNSDAGMSKKEERLL